MKIVKYKITSRDPTNFREKLQITLATLSSIVNIFLFEPNSFAKFSKESKYDESPLTHP